MPEDYSINGFKCANETIYKALKEADLETKKLNSIDKNSDGTISQDEYKSVEDDLVSVEGELEEEDNKKEDKKTDSSSGNNGEYSDNEQVAALQKKYEKTFKEIKRKRDSLGNLKALLGGAEAEAAYYEKDSDAKSSANGLVESLQNQINSVQSEIAQGYANLATIQTNIQQAIANANNAANSTSAAAQTTNTNRTANTEGASSTGNISAVSGSGKDLANVTGDLSICLDRMASSLGKTREETADYVATVCQKAGNGYFDPKVIVSMVFSESGGDNSASSDPNYVGFGQMSAVAVEEVNNQFGTNFTFADMNNPAKNLEAAVYLLRFQYERYDHDLGKALTAYNVGNCESGVVNNYATTIMSRV